MPPCIPGSLQITWCIHLLKTHCKLDGAVPIFKRWFRKLPNLLSWEPTFVWLRAKCLKSLQGSQKWYSRDHPTGLRTRLLNVIGSFQEFKGLPTMCFHAIEAIMELTLSCSSPLLAAVPFKVPGLTSLTALSIWVTKNALVNNPHWLPYQ